MASPALQQTTEEGKYPSYKYVVEFKKFCERTGADPSPEQLYAWDIEHNDSKLNAHFDKFYGEDYVAIAKRTLFSRYFQWANTVILKIGNRKITMTTVRYDKKTGRHVDLASSQLTEKQLDNVKERIQQCARNAADKLRLIKGLSKREIINLFTEALEESLS